LYKIEGPIGNILISTQQQVASKQAQHGICVCVKIGNGLVKHQTIVTCCFGCLKKLHHYSCKLTPVDFVNHNTQQSTKRKKTFETWQAEVSLRKPTQSKVDGLEMRYFAPTG
jgi:hypothetical protein